MDFILISEILKINYWINKLTVSYSRSSEMYGTFDYFITIGYGMISYSRTKFSILKNEIKVAFWTNRYSQEKRRQFGF